MVKVDCVLDAKAKLGEAALWCERDQVLWWADIEGRTLHRFDPATGRDTSIELPSRIGCFALRSQGGFVVALEDGFHFLDADGQLDPDRRPRGRHARQPVQRRHHRSARVGSLPAPCRWDRASRWRRSTGCGRTGAASSCSTG